MSELATVGPPRAHRSDVDVGAAWAAWMGGCSSDTVRGRTGDLVALGRFLELQGWPAVRPRDLAGLLAEITPGQARGLIAAWRTWMVVQGLAGTSIARRISTVSSWLRELGEHGLGWSVRLPRPRIEAYQRQQCPPWADVCAVIDELEASGRVRELVPVLLLAHVGLRRAEACSLELPDVLPPPAPAVRVVRKGGAAVTRTISLRCARAIEASAEGRTRGPLLVSAVGGRLTPDGLAEITTRLGLGAPHGLRHAGATELYRRTHDAELVRDWLGHANLATTQRYVQMLEDSAGAATRLLAGET